MPPWWFPFYSGPPWGGVGYYRFSTLKWETPTHPLNTEGDHLHISYDIYIYVWCTYDMPYIYTYDTYVFFCVCVRNCISVTWNSCYVVSPIVMKEVSYVLIVNSKYKALGAASTDRLQKTWRYLELVWMCCDHWILSIAMVLVCTALLSPETQPLKFLRALPKCAKGMDLLGNGSVLALGQAGKTCGRFSKMRVRNF